MKMSERKEALALKLRRKRQRSKSKTVLKRHTRRNDADEHDYR